jgi:HlyD family secretion protein
MGAQQGVPAQPRSRGIFKKLAMAVGLLGLGGAVTAISIQVTPGRASLGPISVGKESPPAAAPARAKPNWVAAAPGRVESRNGQVRIAAGMAGRITEVLVRVNERVAEGEVLVRLDDAEARARLAAAEAEAAARKRERDAQPATAGREDIRKAEDAVFAAERAVMNARFELDEMMASDRRRNGRSQQAQARKRLAEALDRLSQEQAVFAMAQAKGNVPGPNRFEAGVAAARAEVSMAEAVLAKTRIRAPMAGTVLQVNAKVGELAAPSPEMPLVTMGDMSVLRVRAEVDEADVAKIKLGQTATVRSNAYPGQEFAGKVAQLAPLLAPPRMGSRGARRATDVEVLEVLIDLEGSVPLLPGMRAEAFFR